jgi:hypothetical protein
MENKNVPAFVLLFIILLQTAAADVGPKPTADFQVTYSGGKVSDEYFSAVMLACSGEGYSRQPSVVDNAPQLNVSIYDAVKNCSWTPAWFAWTDSNPKGNCHQSACSFSYNPPKDFKLAVWLPSQNKVFISNETMLSDFNSHLNVDLSPDGSAAIAEAPSGVERHPVLLFLIALPITLALELLFGFVFLLLAKLPKKILIYLFIANLISLPIVWFVFPLMGNILIVVIASELFAVVFEAAVIYAFGRRVISVGKSLLLSVIANAASFFIGGAIFLVIYGLLTLSGFV